jgi:hypothetical protein
MVAAHDLVSLVFLVGSDDDYSSRIAVDFFWALEFIFGEILLIGGKQMLDSYIL